MARSKDPLSRILIIPDTHVPYHDERAWLLLLQVAQAFGFDYVIVVGDFLDCYYVSAHSKSPSRVRVVRLESDAELRSCQRSRPRSKSDGSSTLTH